MRRLILAIFPILFLFAFCNNDVSEYSGGDVRSIPENKALTKQDAMLPADQTPAEGSEEQLDFSANPGKYLIKEANLTLEVKDVHQTAEQIKSSVKKYQAFVQDENYEHSEFGDNYTLTIRVPVDKFDTLIKQIEGFGTVIDKRISTEDVTAQVVDIEARLKIKYKIRDEYQELLKRCKTIKDVLEVKDRLRAVQEEIEAIEARLKYYKTNAAYSTINLVLVEPETTPGESFDFFGKLQSALKGAWYLFLYILIIVLAALPFVLVGFVIYKVVKKLRKRKAK